MELPMDYCRERHRLSPGSASLPKQHGVGENESLTHWTVQRSVDLLETRDPTRSLRLPT